MVKATTNEIFFCQAGLGLAVGKVRSRIRVEWRIRMPNFEFLKC